MDDNEIRKSIWTRRDAVDAKQAEAAFAELTPDEQDAWVLSLMLDQPLDLTTRYLRGEANAEEMQPLWNGLDELFKYGKRSALRPLKEVLARHPTLKKPEA